MLRPHCFIPIALLAWGAHAQTYCEDGLTVQPGSSCAIYSTDSRFEVHTDGRGCLGGICGTRSLNLRANNITLVASANADGSWTIQSVSPAPPGTAPPPDPKPDPRPDPKPAPTTGKDDHGNTPLAASWLPDGPYAIEGNLERVDDVDAFRFDLQGQAIYRIRARGNLDTRGRLLNSDGDTVLENDDAGGNLNFTLRARLEPGTYYVLVDSDNDTGPYSLLATPERDDDHGNNLETSTPTPLNTWLSGRAEDGDDTDAFRFDLPRATDVTVHTRGPADTYGYLRDAARQTLAEGGDGGPDDNFRFERTLEAGIYYVEIGAAARGNYALRVDAADDGMCPIPAPEEPEEPERPPVEPDPPPTGDALSGTLTTCSGTRNAVGTVNVSMGGTVTAVRDVFNIRVEGSANGQFVGVDIISSLDGGETRRWSISGIITTDATRLRCNANIEWQEFRGPPGALMIE